MCGIQWNLFLRIGRKTWEPWAGVSDQALFKCMRGIARFFAAPSDCAAVSACLCSLVQAVLSSAYFSSLHRYVKFG